MLLRSLLIFVLLIALGTGAVGLWCWQDLHSPAYHRLQGQPLEIDRGERLDQALSQLQKVGILHHTLPLRIYMRLTHKEPIVQAGAYYFTSPITPLAVLGRLAQAASFDRLTVIEGWTRWDVANAMLRLPALRGLTEDQVINLFNDCTGIADLDPAAKSLEGYLFPDTYFIAPNSSSKEVVSDMVKRFRQIWSKDLQQLAQQHGNSVHDAVTIASIIETEAKLKSERPVIASVIMNRLKRGMPLSMDSTIVYASKMAGAWKNDGKVYQSDLDRSSPYNTRKNAGLPPGPVGNPGLSSLEAALTPATTDYLYYVRDPARADGAHNFYADEKSFFVGVQALRDWEQKQKQH